MQTGCRCRLSHSLSLRQLTVQAYVWLHKGAFGCAEDLVKGKKTTKSALPSSLRIQADRDRFVDYAMHRVRMLKHHGITPYIVFDGGPLPAKKGTEDKRAKSALTELLLAKLTSQVASRKPGASSGARGARQAHPGPRILHKMPRRDAGDGFSTHQGASSCTVCGDTELTVEALRAEQIEYVVAPYEADAQLCYLERSGLVDGIITEDSDLLVFGCQQVSL